MFVLGNEKITKHVKHSRCFQLLPVQQSSHQMLLKQRFPYSETLSVRLIDNRIAVGLLLAINQEKDDRYAPVRVIQVSTVPVLEVSPPAESSQDDREERYHQPAFSFVLIHFEQHQKLAAASPS